MPSSGLPLLRFFSNPSCMAVMCRFYQAKRAEQQQAAAGPCQLNGGTAPSPLPATCLPGRVLYLRRLKPLCTAQLAGAQGPQRAQQEAPAPGGATPPGAPASSGEAAARMEAGAVPRDAAPGTGTSSAACCGGCCGGCIPLCGGKGQRESHKTWDAVWVAPAAVAQEGILVSKRSVHDHFVSRLLSVLRRLAGAARVH
jgi:hypothetical protein